MPLLPAFDAVLCKTRHAERIFRALGSDARYVGFTSPDRMREAVPRERVFLHLAGRSSAKGTQTKDSFSLRGFTAAMDEAAKQCAK